MIDEYLRIILRNLKRRALRSSLTMLGIFIGIAAVVSLIGLGQGLEEGITGQFASIGSDRVTILPTSAGFGPPGSFTASRLTERDFSAVERTRGIKRAATRMLRTTSIEFNEELRFGVAITLPKENEQRRLIFDSINLDIVSGRELNPSDQYKVVLASSYADTDYFGKFPRVGNKILINNQEFDIVGMYGPAASVQFNDFVLMNEDVAREVLNITEGEVDFIVAQVNDVDDMDGVKERLSKALRSSRGVDEGEEDFDIQTPQEIVETFNSILGVVQGVIIGLAGISLLVGGVGIANTMFTSVIERRREIGILKAVGARNSSIVTLFVLESGVLGFFGGLIGMILGVLFTLAVVAIGTAAFGEGLIQASFSPVLLLGVIAFSFTVGIISGVVPAKQAASIPPVEALRK